MLVTRKVDREAINLQRQGQLGVYASCMGQEAAQVGSAYALAEEDWIFPSYRELGAALVRRRRRRGRCCTCTAAPGCRTTTRTSTTSG